MSSSLDLGGWLFLTGAWLSIIGLTVWCLVRVLATRDQWGGRDDGEAGAGAPHQHLPPET